MRECGLQKNDFTVHHIGGKIDVAIERYEEYALIQILLLVWMIGN